MDTEVPKRRSGRPKKADEDKVQYQRIAVYFQDYEKLAKEIEKRGVKLTDAFTDMVRHYVGK